MTDANVLISQGEAAVKAELARIESVLQAAKLKATGEAAVVVQALKTHLDAHAAEVKLAEDLLTLAGGVMGAEVARIVPPTVLANAGKVGAKIKAWLTPAHIRTLVLSLSALAVVHFLVKTGVL